MSTDEIKKVSRQDIQLVQNLIERCLQLYMNQKEVVTTLLHQAKIEPDFTELVWQKLEEENQEFFRAYYLRLVVKDQIQRFNDLLERQVDAMQIYATGSIPMSNGSTIRPVPQNSAHQVTDHTGPIVKLENIHQSLNGNLPHVYTNGTSSVQSCAQAAIDISAHARIIDVSPNMLLSQRSNLGMMQGPNGEMIKSAVYSGDSRFRYGTENVLEARPGTGDLSVSPFSNLESNPQPVTENTLDADTSLGFLGQIPRNFSLSDLTADFSNDILESYTGSAFLGTNADQFLDPQGRGEHQEINRLDTISEGLSYEDFTSD